MAAIGVSMPKKESSCVLKTPLGNEATQAATSARSPRCGRRLRLTAALSSHPAPLPPQSLKIAQGVAGVVRDKGSVRRNVPYLAQAVRQGFQVGGNQGVRASK